MVEHREAEKRFVLAMPEGEAKLAYQMASPTVMNMVSTFVPSAARGKGTGAKLAEAALLYAREHNLQVIPSCWYVSDYIEKHPDFATLLEPSEKRASPQPNASCDIE